MLKQKARLAGAFVAILLTLATVGAAQAQPTPIELGHHGCSGPANTTETSSTVTGWTAREFGSSSYCHIGVQVYYYVIGVGWVTDGLYVTTASYKSITESSSDGGWSNHTMRDIRYVGLDSGTTYS